MLVERQARLLRQLLPIPLQAFQDVPALPLGLYYQPVAYRNNPTGMLTGLILSTSVRHL